MTLQCYTAPSLHHPPTILQQADSGRLIKGMGGGGQYGSIWIPDPALGNATEWVRSFRLSLCSNASTAAAAAAAAPPAPPLPYTPNPYPFAVDDSPNLLRSHELQLAGDHDPAAIPKPRMWCVAGARCPGCGCCSIAKGLPRHVDVSVRRDNAPGVATLTCATLSHIGHRLSDTHPHLLAPPDTGTRAPLWRARGWTRDWGLARWGCWPYTAESR